MFTSLFLFGFLRLSVPPAPEHFVESVQCDPKAPPITVRLTVTSVFTTRACATPTELFSASGPPGGPLGLRLLRLPPDDIQRPGPGLELFGRRYHAVVTVEGTPPARTETLRLYPTQAPMDLVFEFYRAGGEAPSSPEAAVEAFKQHLIKLEITP